MYKGTMYKVQGTKYKVQGTKYKVQGTMMDYDESIKKAEAIITELEQAQAIGMEEYKKKAAEATSLLQYCQSLITEMHQDIPV